MNQASHLYRLQRIDTQLDQKKRRLEEILAILQSDQSVSNADKNVKEIELETEKRKKVLKQIEDTVQSLRIKCETSESSLYGGTIRNPKELQDIQHEILSLKKRIEATENEQLEAMLELEQVDKDVVNAKKSLGNAQSSFATQQAGLLGEQKQLNSQIEKLETERNGLLSSILSENLSVYERLRIQKRGVAVSLIEDNSCATCGSSLRPAECQSARAPQQMAFCSSCGRILYAG